MRSLSLKAASAAFLLTHFLSLAASAQCNPTGTSQTGAAIQTMQDMFKTMGYPLALFMMVYMGAKWAIAEGPEDRENARRGIIYIVIALLLLKAAPSFTVYLLC
jgi:hypothetical protein